jgi:predicted amidohydrolase YtcJ
MTRTRTDDPDELLLEGGTVHLMDDDRTTAEAVLFRNGRVATVGDRDDVRATAVDPETIALDGRPVFPGFNDAHTHVFSVGIQRIETDLSTAPDRETALSMLADNAVETDPGDWVLGVSYDESTWPAGEREYLSREELDEVSEDHPVVAYRVDGHTAGLNSVALDAVDFEGVEHDVVEDGGRRTGRVVEEATGRVRTAAHPDVDELRTALSAASEYYHELGVTSVQTVAGVTTPLDHGSLRQEALHAARRAGDLDLRVTYYVHATQAASLSDLQLGSPFGDDYLRVGGLKTFSDGSLGAQTAFLHEEYADDPGNEGTMVFDGDRLETWFREAARADQQIATHAIGGAAIEEVLDRYEAVLNEYSGDVDPRLRIEHVELASDEALERMADAGIVASMQPNFLQWSRPDGLYESRLGADALSRNNRFADVLERDIPLAFGSDKMPPGPLYGIHHAVTADYESQRLTVDEAVAAYTRGAAYAEFAENEKGTLEPGAFADAVVLDADPYDDPEAVVDRSVETTIVGGTVVYEAD